MATLDDLIKNYFIDHDGTVKIVLNGVFVVAEVKPNINRELTEIRLMPS